MYMFLNIDANRTYNVASKNCKWEWSYFMNRILDGTCHVVSLLRDEKPIPEIVYSGAQSSWLYRFSKRRNSREKMSLSEFYLVPVALSLRYSRFQT